MKPNYGCLEEKVIGIFKESPNFYYNSSLCEAIIIGKPYPQKGECKTDVYIQAKEKNTQKPFEIKISVKGRSSNEFQENKMTADRAAAYFGANWSNIISSAAKSIETKFAKQYLIYARQCSRTKADSYTLGWKLEIANRERGLSSRLPLTDAEIRNFIYKGISQDPIKRNSRVEDKEIIDSGVAEYLLETEISEIVTPMDVIKRLTRIDDAKMKDHFLIFTANNYRTRDDSADGPRSLAVYVEWTISAGKLKAQINYDRPLELTGDKDIKPMLLCALRQIGKMHPSELDPNNDLENPAILYK